MKYIFGPVPSRRLGLSLGIDVIPFKVCSLDCIYCECGRTTDKTLKRKNYVSTENIIKELKEFLKKNIYFDYITFSGSGEPTLNSEIGIMINEIRKIISPDKKIAVLTNGTLFYQKEVRKDLLNADLVIPSLDAVSRNAFLKINRPELSLDISKIIDGLMKFREEFKGEIWLEIFFLKGINDSNEEVELLIDVVNKIKPDRVQLNTIDRPPAEKWAKGLSFDEMNFILNKFLEKVRFKVEIIKRFDDKGIDKLNKNNIEKAEELILELIKRRPETLSGLSKFLNMHINNLNKILSILEEKNKITTVMIDDKVFYKLK